MRLCRVQRDQPQPPSDSHARVGVSRSLGEVLRAVRAHAAFHGARVILRTHPRSLSRIGSATIHPPRPVADVGFRIENRRDSTNTSVGPNRLPRRPPSPIVWPVRARRHHGATEARRSRSAIPCHSGASGGCSTMIHSAPSSSHRCNSAYKPLANASASWGITFT